MKNLFTTIRNYIFAFRMMRFKRQADAMRDTTGIQHYIVIINGKITIVNRHWLKQQRQLGILPRWFTADNLRTESYYVTRP